jgi:hypothetical protein
MHAWAFNAAMPIRATKVLLQEETEGGGAPQIIEQEVTEETERPRFLRRGH